MKFVGNRVLLVLILGGFPRWVGSRFTTAPNRLVIGIGFVWIPSWSDGEPLLLLPAALLVLGVFLPQVRRTHLAMAIAASLLLAGLVWLAGAHALRLAETGSAISRTSFGGGFWLLVFFSWLAAVDSIQRLRLGAPGNNSCQCGGDCTLLRAAACGRVGPAIAVEGIRQPAGCFHTAFFRHLGIVLATLLPTLLIGIPLGVASFRREHWRIPLFAVLNVIRDRAFDCTLRPVAGALGVARHAGPGVGRLGIGGVGIAPAVIALTMYSLPFVARSTVAGLTQVPRPVIEAATGMGMSRGQIWRRVELLLALPVFLPGCASRRCRPSVSRSSPP